MIDFDVNSIYAGMPLLRKQIPALTAQQIVGVQPMGPSTGEIFKTFLIRKYNKKYWPYQYDVSREDRWDIEQWCWQNFKGRNWHSNGSKFVFKRKEDAMLFVLRWSC